MHTSPSSFSGPCCRHVSTHKHIVPLIISIVLPFAFLLSRPPAEPKYGGSGEPNDPYLIYTAEQMNEIGANRGD